MSSYDEVMAASRKRVQMETRLRRERHAEARAKLATSVAASGEAQAATRKRGVFEWDAFDGFCCAPHQAVEMHCAHGEWGATPIGVWGRPRVPLVAGRQDLPRERVLMLADAQSGMGVPLDPDAWSFVNPDLTVYFERDPVGGWLGFDIRSTACSVGVGLAQSEIRDREGVVGRSAQSLFVAPRPPEP